MHLVNVTKDLCHPGIGTIPADDYFLEDRTMAELFLMFGDSGMKATAMSPVGTCSQDRVLIHGTLGMGDAIMLTPALRGLAKKFDEVFVCCPDHYRQPLLNLPYVAGFVDWPMNAAHQESYCHISLENFPNHPLARTHHMSDVFAAICGVTLTDHKEDYLVTNEEREWAFSTFPKTTGVKRLGLQVQASHRCRTYPAAKLRDLMQSMTADGWEVYLMGAPNEFQCKEISRVHDLRTKAPTFRESAAFLLTCDAFVGPDSGFLHAAGAIGVPSVGLFGPFPWKLRTAHYPSVFAIQGEGRCSPCFYGPNRLQPNFPSHGPCALTGKCEVLNDIEPRRIKAKLEQIISSSERLEPLREAQG